MDKAILFLKSQNGETALFPKGIQFDQTKEKAAIQRGAFLIDAYNCTGCHRIDDKGIDINGDHVPDGGYIYNWFKDHSDEMFRAPPKLINEGRKVYPDWLFSFLKAPSKLRENFKVRMPTFQFTDDEAGDIVAYFAAKAGSTYPFIDKHRPAPSAEDKEQAAKLFAAAQCLSCHILDGASKDPKNVAPNLRLAAERLQYDWIFDWLKDPQAMAPGVAMPGFFTPVDDKPGEYTTPLPEFANGDWKKQITLLRAFVIGAGQKPELAQADPHGGATAAAVGPADHKKKKGVR
jgi:mono/diheme cytochrome c family protein